MNNEIPKVQRILENGNRLVINKGSYELADEGDHFLVYGIGEEILDIDTQESYGHLEIVRGIGKVIHVQDKILIIESIERTKPDRKVIKTKGGMSSLLSSNRETEEEILSGHEEIVPFYNPKLGDFAKEV